MSPKAKARAEVILKVRSGQMTATAAAQELGISRQQYYQWEQRALQALLTSLEDQQTAGPKRRRTRRRNNCNAGWNNWSSRCSTITRRKNCARYSTNGNRAI